MRVVHFQRLEDALAEIVVHAFARDAFDEQDDVVGGTPVLPIVAGMKIERERREIDKILLNRFAPIAHKLALVVGQCSAVGVDAGRVGEDMADRDGSFGFYTGVTVIGFFQDFLAFEFGNPFCDGIVEQEVAFFVEHHERDGGDGFGHGHHDEDGVFGHGRVGLNVAVPLGLEVHDFPFTCDEGDGPCEQVVVNVLLHDRAETVEPLGGHADGFRSRGGDTCVGIGSGPCGNRKQA